MPEEWWGEAPERPRDLAKGCYIARPIEYIGPKRPPSRAEDTTTLQRDERINRYFLHGRAYPNEAGLPACWKMARAGMRLGDLSAQYIRCFAVRNNLANLSRKFRSLAPPMFGLRSQFRQLKNQVT